MWNAGDLSFLWVAREVPAIAIRAAVYREPTSPVFLAGNQGRFCLGAACVAVLRLASLVAEGCVMFSVDSFFACMFASKEVIHAASAQAVLKAGLECRSLLGAR